MNASVGGYYGMAGATSTVPIGKSPLGGKDTVNRCGLGDFDYG